MTSGEEERRRLKEEYKDHYRRIRETKEKLRQAKRTRSISDALGSMDQSALMASMDEFLYKLRTKIAQVEARLDLALEDLDEDSGSGNVSRTQMEEHEETIRRTQARDTLRQVKAEMGSLYSEIEQQADEIHADKTIGPASEEEEEEESSASSSTSQKTSTSE